VSGNFFQGIAYKDFDLIEPGVLANVVLDSKNGKGLPEAVEGKLAARVAMDVLVRLQQ